MEHEAQQMEGAQPSSANKPSFIYAKNPTNAAKAITRKMRPSHLPISAGALQAEDLQNRTVPDDVRNSQIEAETIATQGNSGLSPRTAALSTSAHNLGPLIDQRLGPSEAQHRRLDNRTQNTSNRTKTGRSKLGNNTYYEDNIDSETEVFFDPQFESKLTNTMPNSRDLFNQMPGEKPRGKDDYQRGIDAKNRALGGRTEEKPGKPVNSKRYMREMNDSDDQESGFRHQRRFTNPAQKTAKSQNRKTRVRRIKPDENLRELMPEMDQFIDKDIDRQNYLTQDETGNGESRLVNQGTLGHNKAGKQRGKNESGIASQDEGFKLSQSKFTPGKIRASRMGYSQNNFNEFPSQQNQNFLRSPVASQDLSSANFGYKKRARTKLVTGRQAANDLVNINNDSFESIGQQDQLLPVVKMQQKRGKKRSASNSPKKDRSPDMDNDSVERVAKRLKPTLDQGLHFVHASVNVPVKQTNFYDNKHGSAITEQQMKQWQIKNGEVRLDTFNKKNTIPTNRHRIPAVAAPQMQQPKLQMEQAPKKARPANHGKYGWDLDGRIQKKTIKKNAQIISSNQAVSKVDLPNIGPSKLSPRGQIHKSQPSGKMPNSKFIDPHEPRAKKLKPAPTQLNAQSQLIDIELPNREPRGKIHEPPIDPPIETPVITGDAFGRFQNQMINNTAPENPVNENLGPNYDCPVCKQHVLGPDTAKHSRLCRTHRCSYCLIEQPIADLDKHESTCGNMRSCEFCFLDFQIPDFKMHQIDCPEATTCKICQLRQPRKQMLDHETLCKIEQKCRFCRNSYRVKILSSHEASCSQHIRCDFCKIELSKDDYDFHLERCSQVATCRFCGNLFKAQDIETHESEQCPQHTTCQFCNLVLSKSNLEQHVIKECPKAKPGCTDQEVDPRPYRDMLQKNAQKLKKRNSAVVVEDDFVTPQDFRDPGGRKNNTSPSDFTNPIKIRGKRENSAKSNPSLSVDRSSPLRRGGRDSSAAKPPLSPTVAAQDLTPTYKSKRSPRINMSNEKAKGILKGDQRTPTKSRDKSIHISQTRDRNNGEGNINRFSGRSRRGAQTRQGSGSQDLNHVRHPDDKSAIINSEHQLFNEQLLRSIKSNDLIPGNTIDDNQCERFNNENYGEDVGNKISHISQDVPLQKTKSMNNVSQVRFAYHTSETHVQDEEHTEYQIKMHKSMERKTVSRVQETRKQSRLSKNSKKSVEQYARRNTAASNSREGGHQRIRRSGMGMYFPESGEQPKRISSGPGGLSKSPQTRKVMETLTHHRVKIDKNTKMLINGREVLTHKGIKGNIHKVGVGFGTGRHTSGRRLDLLKEVPIQDELPERADSQEPGHSTPIIEPIVNQHRRKPEKRDAGVQIQQDLQSEGCDPIMRSMRSQVISAHYSQRDVNLSARTMTQLPDAVSAGVSAKPPSQKSVREQGDQVTEGRFDPHTINENVGTDSRLLDEYFKKSMADGEANTVDIIFGQEKPRTTSCLVQTEDRLNEQNLPSDPILPTTSYEPITGQKNIETGSNGSIMDEPEPVEAMPVPVCNYVDDWYESELFKYSFELHYDRLVEEKLIRIEEVSRPEVPKECEGMNIAQRLDHNLNPEGLAILSHIESEYGQEVLRHKSAKYNNEQMLQDLYDRAKTTIVVLETNMVRPEINSKILFTHYNEVSKKNVTKLLIRVKKLYEARNEALNILKKVMEAEWIMSPKELVWRVLQNDKRDVCSEAERNLLLRALKILSDALTLITIFQQEHRLFRDEFRFNNKQFRVYMQDIGRIVGGHLKVRNETNPSLQETGLLLDEHLEDEEQVQRYEEWVNASHAKYGILDVPSEKEIEETLQPEEPARKVKGSRIDRAVEKMRQEQAIKSETNSIMEMTSKSKILAQMQIKVDRYQEEEILGKTVISDQLIDRLKASAEKKAKINTMRDQMNTHDDLTNEDKGQDCRMPNKHLTAQQMNYDGDMEDQLTLKNQGMSQVVGERGVSDSILSNPTDMLGNIRNVVKSGDFDNYQAINANKYDFTSSQSNEGYSGQVYEQHLNVLAQPTFNAYSAVNRGRQFSVPYHPHLTREIPVHDPYPQDHTARFDGSEHTMSEITRMTQHQQLMNGDRSEANLQEGFPQAVISEIEADDTEFTEQFDLSLHNISHEQDVEMAMDDQSAIEDLQTVQENKSNAKSTSLKILNHGSVKIKYAADSRSVSHMNDQSAIGTDREHQVGDQSQAEHSLSEINQDAIEIKRPQTSSNHQHESLDERE